MINLLAAIWRSPYTAIVFRLVLGTSFIVAPMYKIVYPGEFAENVAGFQLVPYLGVNFMAVIMPWIELVTGLFLILGIRTRAAASIIGALLIVFTVAIVINLVQGTPINCGCFEAVGEPLDWWLVIRDVGMLIMAIQIILYDRLFIFDRGGFILREKKI
ncbi:MAG: DoxX family membrane protein [Deltaproteobacteria bacterium]|nr:DoxX family membrane protein [Deltaproteobacteria bacterium]MBW1951740.1 DoxX family membrane protein [Deltaproteobacteria bacterium]MBW1986863.1 DoxX family membrane protein [Deltaproteobacteria bacterium]MBW2134988.1 DoxX family membrane protein [Deltaproteobacteria bacterium]